ncbi:MAG: spermidine/putrescine ABC transporter permease [Chloroflexi bacterium GWC2_73_18]|nr:MAG: spermidine/putrescine ABC transporter permease [Chloroflexi bacterium GWC2_73_18]
MGAHAGRIVLRLAAGGVLVFLYIPLAIIVLYAFNDAKSQSWPIEAFSLRWFGVALGNAKVRDAFLLSFQAALGATTIALLLGSAAAFAVHRFRFFGRDTISFLVVLPLALPGIVTGMALNSAINFGIERGGPSFGLITIIVGHATFCIVVVYNNVIARLRRIPRSMEEASMDLGADSWQTFRYVTLPAIATALVAGGLLAFALSWDEIIVTTFTAGTDETLPVWIFSNFRLPNFRPVVNVVALFLILLSAIPVYAAARLTGGSGQVGTR